MPAARCLLLVPAIVAVACAGPRQAPSQSAPPTGVVGLASQPPAASVPPTDPPSAPPSEDVAPHVLAAIAEHEQREVTRLLGPLRTGTVYRATGPDGAHLIVAFEWMGSRPLVGLVPAGAMYSGEMLPGARRLSIQPRPTPAEHGDPPPTPIFECVERDHNLGDCPEIGASSRFTLTPSGREPLVFERSTAALSTEEQVELLLARWGHAQLQQTSPPRVTRAIWPFVTPVGWGWPVQRRDQRTQLARPEHATEERPACHVSFAYDAVWEFHVGAPDPVVRVHQVRPLGGECCAVPSYADPHRFDVTPTCVPLE